MKALNIARKTLNSKITAMNEASTKNFKELGKPIYIKIIIQITIVKFGYNSLNPVIL